MSLELTLIPLALVVANVMDKDYYGSWIKNKRVKKGTSYEALEDFVADLNRTDYHYTVLHDTVRICARDNRGYYYFTNIKGEWVLSFSDYDSREEVAGFLKELASVSEGRVSADLPVFGGTPQRVVKQPALHKMPALSEKQVAFYPTIFRDRDLLLDVLQKQGLRYSLRGDDIDFTLEGIRCTFLRDEDKKYVLRTLGPVTEEDLYRNLQELDLVYQKNVQKMAYDSVMERLETQNMKLAGEKRLEDGTVVLTLNVE